MFQRCPQETSAALEVGTDHFLHARDLAVSSHRGPQELGVAVDRCAAARASVAHLWQPLHNASVEELVSQMAMKAEGCDTFRTAPEMDTTGCDTLRLSLF